MNKSFHAYWLVDKTGAVISRIEIVNDTGDNICIGAYDANGKYQQFDSCEAYHAHEWALGHGFEVRSQKMSVDVDTNKFD